MRVRATAAVAASMIWMGVLGCAHEQPQEVVLTTTQAEAYRSVELDGAFAVEIEVGPAPSIELSGDEDAVERVRVHVHGDHLRLDADRQPFDGEVLVRVTTPALDRVDLDGAAKVRLAGLRGGALSVEVDGAGSARAEGRLDSLDLRIRGAASVDARRLVAQRVDVEISGAGSAQVYATERLEAEVSGVGSIQYAGKPPSVAKNVSGVGTISPIS